MKYQLLTIGLLLSANVLASEEVPSAINSNVVGVNLGFGTQDLEVQGLEIDDGSDNWALDIYYRRMLSNNWGIEVGHHSGTAGIARAFASVLDDLSDVDYKGIKLAGYGRFNAAENSYFYGKLGANFHNVDFTYGKTEYDESGVGAFVAAGWEYTFKSGIALNLEIQHLPMDELKVTTFNYGMSYHF